MADHCLQCRVEKGHRGSTPVPPLHTVHTSKGTQGFHTWVIIAPTVHIRKEAQGFHTWVITASSAQ